MVEFTAPLLKFEKHGEKTGWTYIVVPAAIAQRLKRGNKKSFRVKGKLDDLAIKGVALLPVGDGDFIIPLNGAMRKGMGKRNGAMLAVQIMYDSEEQRISPDLMESLNDAPNGASFFNSLTRSHQRYFSKWIESAKTEQTKAQRIAESVNALMKGQDFGTMLRALKHKRL